MKIRIEAASAPELNRIEAAVRRVLRIEHSGHDLPGPSGRGVVRYLTGTAPPPGPTVPASLFGYRQGSGARPTPVQLTHARRLLAGRMWADRVVPRAAYDLAEEILAAGDAACVPVPSAQVKPVD